jgi:hypothetical protein
MRSQNLATKTKKETTHDVSSLLALLNYFYPLSKEIEAFLRAHANPCSFRRGKLILKAGDICGLFYKKGRSAGIY